MNGKVKKIWDFVVNVIMEDKNTEQMLSLAAEKNDFHYFDGILDSVLDLYQIDTGVDSRKYVENIIREKIGYPKGDKDSRGHPNFDKDD